MQQPARRRRPRPAFLHHEPAGTDARAVGSTWVVDCRLRAPGSKPGSCRRLGRRLLYLFAAWFPGGAAISPPCVGSFPARSSRTWCVTPSGSQPEAFAVEQGSVSSTLSTPHRRLRPRRRGCRALFRARQRRETREHRCHGQSPLGVGPWVTLALSRAATHNADRALPGVTARMGGSDFHAPPPASSLFTLVRRCPPPADRCAEIVL